MKINIGTKKNWIDFDSSFKKGLSLAFSFHCRMRKKHLTITFFSRKRIESYISYIDFRVRFPKRTDPEQSWFDITIANHMLNFGLL